MAEPIHRIAIPPHWRPELVDVANTIREARDRGDDPRVVTGPRALLSLLRPDSTLAVVFSDAEPARPVGAIAVLGRGTPGRVLRVWWNGADEVLAARPDGVPNGRHAETHVCFFREAFDEIAAAGLDVVQVPYAFSPPRPQGSGREVRIAYTAEVDISDDCFRELPVGDATVRATSTETWDLTQAVVAGELTMVEADQRLRRAVEEIPQLHRTALWAMRNRVRYALLKQIAEAFAGRIALRGSDWAKVGLDAEPTSFRRRTRMSEYADFRVSLDLGSKSTHAALYPRTADILSVAGGIVQFDSGDPLPNELAPLEGRRARSLDGVLEKIDLLLGMRSQEVFEQNIEIHRAYCALRRSAGQALLQAIRVG